MTTTTATAAALNLHHRLRRRSGLATIQTLHGTQLHRAAHDAATHDQLQTVIGDLKNVSSFAESQQPDAISHLGTPAWMLASLRFRAMTILELSQPLTCLPSRFAVGLSIP